MSVLRSSPSHSLRLRISSSSSSSPSPCAFAISVLSSPLSQPQVHSLTARASKQQFFFAPLKDSPSNSKFKRVTHCYHAKEKENIHSLLANSILFFFFPANYLRVYVWAYLLSFFSRLWVVVCALTASLSHIRRKKKKKKSKSQEIISNAMFAQTQLACLTWLDAYAAVAAAPSPRLLSPLLTKKKTK